jgi:hypothetical protein
MLRGRFALTVIRHALHAGQKVHGREFPYNWKNLAVTAICRLTWHYHGNPARLVKSTLEWSPEWSNGHLTDT